MSETTEAPVTEAPEPAAQPVDAPATPDAAPQTEAPVAAPEAPQPVAEEPKKPKPADRRFAHLSAKLASEAQRAEQAEQRAAAAEALLQQRQQPEGDTPPAARPAPQGDLEARAAQLVAEREFNRRLSEIDTAGKKDIGAEAWESAKEIMTGLGATKNAAFLSALAEAENPAQIFADLAEDTDTLVELLNKQPAAMAARIGRMDAKLSQPKAAPVSKAPPPAPKVGGTQVVPEPDEYDPKLSMAEWVRVFDKKYPHLVGRARRTD